MQEVVFGGETASWLDGQVLPYAALEELYEMEMPHEELLNFEMEEQIAYALDQIDMDQDLFTRGDN